MNDLNADSDLTRTHDVLTSGTMVAHYRVVERIGAGGMGEVYLAEDTKLNRKVALKFIPHHLASKEDIKARFMREAQTLAKLNHPNIVIIYDVSEFNGRPYYAMELVEGKSLNDISPDKPLSLESIIEYAIQTCQGLGEAHRAGIVHRDIKPANIIVDEKGRIRLLDFGLAAVAEDDRLTRTGSTLGTISYMSPEQVSGREIDHRSDLFSLGIVLYELIAGRSPFKRDNEGATLKAIMEENPQPLARYRSDVPEKLQQIVFELLEKNIEFRFQTAEGVLAALKRLMYDSTQSGFSKVQAEKTGKRKTTAGFVAFAIIVLAAVSYFIFEISDKETPAAGKTPMIAVLPFENLGPPEDQYFADGMTEEITSRLASINGLGVISRTSSVKFSESDKPLREIGGEYGVDYILEGTVRWSKSGDQPKVRITPQLIRVSDDRHMWADNYERALMEIFAVQADIAEKIVEQLGLTLLESDRVDLASIPTDSPEAYQLYLKSLQKMRGYGESSESFSPREALDSAVVLDPEFALAHALRSEVYTSHAVNSPESENGKKALKAANRAMELDPDLAQAQLALGKYYYHVEANNEKALHHFALARSELYNDPELLEAISTVYMEQGKYEDALQNRSKAVQLDPLNARRHYKLANVLGTLRRFEEEEQSLDRAIALKPEVQDYYVDKISCRIARFGDIEKVIPAIEEALQHCDTTEFILRNSSLARLIQGLPTDSVIADFIEKQTADSSESSLFHGFTRYYLSHLDMIEGNVELAKRQAEYHSGDFIQWRGLLLSFAGECEEAIDCGLQAMELVETSECTP